MGLVNPVRTDSRRIVSSDSQLAVWAVMLSLSVQINWKNSPRQLRHQRFEIAVARLLAALSDAQQGAGKVVNPTPTLRAVTSLGLASLGAATDGVTPIFPWKKNWRPFSVIAVCKVMTSFGRPTSLVPSKFSHNFCLFHSDVIPWKVSPGGSPHPRLPWWRNCLRGRETGTGRCCVLHSESC